MNDKISELLINMKNSFLVKKEGFVIDYSKIKENILSKLKSLNYIEDFKVVDIDGVKKTLKVKLAYDDKGNSKITDLKRVSKLSQRIYFSYKDIMPVKYGKGKMILSTPLGIITGEEAQEKKVGGEVLFKIW